MAAPFPVLTPGGQPCPGASLTGPGLGPRGCRRSGSRLGPPQWLQMPRSSLNPPRRWGGRPSRPARLAPRSPSRPFSTRIEREFGRRLMASALVAQAPDAVGSRTVFEQTTHARTAAGFERRNGRIKSRKRFVWGLEGADERLWPGSDWQGWIGPLFRFGVFPRFEVDWPPPARSRC